ncbi:Myb family transcription factor [Rhynchospora pubera]|uniref:Myb family transcription factor n=1 Tax=Rhynchospora pubera TaxID=906938 RepID=A0AAV8C0W1_9POAL|nr:Myb family transcription factor [Rhynchospora pubera]
MYKRRKQQHQQQQQQKAKISSYDLQEVTSIKWEKIDMTDQEEDIIYRMYRLVGDRWTLIAGRIPGRKPEEIERFWIMRHGEALLRRGKLATIGGEDAN